MTATITYTDGRTLPSCQEVGDALAETHALIGMLGLQQQGSCGFGAGCASFGRAGRGGRLSVARICLGGVVRGCSGFGVEDVADLFGGAEDALADEVAEAGDVLQAGGGRAVAAEDAYALPCRLGDLGDAAGAGDR